MKSRVSLVAILLAFSVVSHASAQAVTEPGAAFVWTGQGFSGSFAAPQNWVGGNVPSGTSGTEFLNFPSARNYSVYFDTSLDVLGLVVGDHFHFSGYSLTFTLRDAGLAFTPANPNTHLAFEGNFNLALGANQTWHIASGSTEVFVALSGEGTLTKTGAGSLMLQHGNINSGGIIHNEGRLVVNGFSGEGTPTSALGTGPLSVGPLPQVEAIYVRPDGSRVSAQKVISSQNGPVIEFRSQNIGRNGQGGTDGPIGSFDLPVIVANDIFLNGHLTTHNDSEVILTGNVTMNTSSSIRAEGSPLFINGSIGEASPNLMLSVNSTTPVILSGTNTYTGGTYVDAGVLIFNPTESSPIPTIGSLSSSHSGYIGYASSSNVVAGFLDRFSKANMHGTVGFDSNPNVRGASPYENAIDLTGFAPTTRLGSATRAVLAGTITPQGADYRFGGGGGYLTVSSPLDANRNLYVDSAQDLPLTLRLTHPTSSFSGTIYANNSGVVLDASVPLPAGVNNLIAGPGGYIGTASSSNFSSVANLNAYLTHFPLTTVGMIGFDLSTGAEGTRVVDLTGAAISTFANAYFATSSFFYDNELDRVTGAGVRFVGTIAPNTDLKHRFAAFKGGALEVAGTLTGNALAIGHPEWFSSFGDRLREQYSSVMISGDNASSLSNGTTLYGGHLILGQSNGTIGTDPSSALGTSALTVAAINFMIPGDDEPIDPLLSSGSNNLILNNPIVLNGYLAIGGSRSFTLGGTISGSGGIDLGEQIEGPFTVTLGGNNTFVGGIYVRDAASVIFNSNTAAGQGPLGFGSSVGSGFAQFNTAAPVVHGLRSNYGGYASLVLTQDNTILTIVEETKGNFSGFITSEAPGNSARVVKTGAGTLSFDSGSLGVMNGTPETSIIGNPLVGLEINQGTLIIGPGFYISAAAPHIWLNGGSLVLQGHQSLYNPLIVSGGALNGSGYFSTATIGSGSAVSPGASANGSEIGFLSFNHLTLGGGGIYQWHIQSADPSATQARDQISINTPNTLEIVATAAQPFVIQPVTLDSAGVGGILGDVEPGQFYSWTLISYQNITGPTRLINPENFLLDTTQFQTSMGGTFSLELTSLSGNGELLLNFTAVPEPSTYVLLALGLGFVVLQVRRQSRAKRDRA